MIRRVESVGSPVENSIRDWHFVQYGSLLLSRLDSTVYVAGGRFRILFPELKEVQAVMLKLRACLDGLGFVPKQILYGASQSSEVLCEVIGGMYNLPTLALTEERYKRYDSLVVVSEAEELSDFYFLAEAKPGKVLFAYNLNWTQETLLTPDIVGVMSESCRFEWQGGSMKVVDFEKGIFERVGTDTRPAPNIAADIVNEGASIEAEFAEDLAFFVKQKAHWQANIHSTRTTFKPESPVKSKES